MWKLRPSDKNKEQKLLSMGYNKLISRLLSQRNVELKDADGFIKSDYKNLSHPYTLNGVREASELFCRVALKRGKIGVVGDYDADGILSSVMIHELCDIFNLDCNVFLPSRVEHGYGLNDKSIVSIKEKFVNPPDLLFISDCGSNNENEIVHLKQWGVKHIVIIDHHIVDNDKKSKSADILINWHLQDNFGETCSCGEVYHFIRGIRCLTKKVNPIEFLSYASIGILADVSPIIGDNRIIVKNGLGDFALKHVASSGCISLIRKAGVSSKAISQEDVLFKIAPRINAVGRISNPDIAFNLLVENDLATAELMAENLSDFNDERKILQKNIQNEAIKIVRSDLLKYEHGILLFNPEWSIGVLGIVASKLVETFHKPSLVIGQNKEVLKGSGRSLDSINLKDLLDGCSEMFDGYGGHALAAGVTIKKEYMDKANDIFNEACKKYYQTHNAPVNYSYYDAIIPPNAVSIKTASLLYQNIYPYCSQYNPEPVFCLKDVKINDIEIAESSKTSKTKWRSINVIIEKDGITSPLKLRKFDSDVGTEILDKRADIYISLPQVLSNQNRYAPQANIIDIVIKK